MTNEHLLRSPVGGQQIWIVLRGFVEKFVQLMRPRELERGDDCDQEEGHGGPQKDDMEKLTHVCVYQL